jgi:hypothetical protein
LSRRMWLDSNFLGKRWMRESKKLN